MKKKQHPAVEYPEKTLSELRAATKDLDRDMVADEFHPMGPAERVRWERARRKPGRPRRGAGAKVISVSVERGLPIRPRCSERAGRCPVSGTREVWFSGPGRRGSNRSGLPSNRRRTPGTGTGSQSLLQPAPASRSEEHTSEL